MQNRTPARTAQAAIGTAALALLATTATGASASTEVTPFGHAQLEVVDYRDTGPSPSIDDYDLTDSLSGHFGVQALQDLGHGRALFARYALRVNTATGRLDEDGDSSTAELGLTTGMGTFSGGHLDSPYRYTGGASYDAFADTTLGAISHGGMTGNERPLFGSDSANSAHEGTVRRALGFRNRGDHVEVWVAASRAGKDTGLDETGSRAEDGEQGDLAASVKTFGANWELFAATATQRRATVADENDAESQRRLLTHKVGGRYIAGNHTWSGQGEWFTSEERHTDAAMDAAYQGDQDGTALFLGYQYDFAPNVFVIQLGHQALEYDNGDEASGTYIATGFVHRLSEESRLFVGYRRTAFEDDLGGDFRQRAFSLGLTYGF